MGLELDIKIRYANGGDNVWLAEFGALVRIYAGKAWIGKGVGAALMRACLDEAASRGHDSIWLGVWERNARAQEFYRKWGFEEAGTQTFQLGDEMQTDLLMQKTRPCGRN